MRWPFRRRTAAAAGRHTLGPAVTGLPSAPVPLPADLSPVLRSLVPASALPAPAPDPVVEPESAAAALDALSGLFEPEPVDVVPAEPEPVAVEPGPAAVEASPEPVPEPEPVLVAAARTVLPADLPVEDEVDEVDEEIGDLGLLLLDADDEPVPDPLTDPVAGLVEAQPVEAQPVGTAPTATSPEPAPAEPVVAEVPAPRADGPAAEPTGPDAPAATDAPDGLVPPALRELGATPEEVAAALQLLQTALAGQAPAPRHVVELGFRDGTRAALDPASAPARELEALAAVLTGDDPR